MIDCVLYKVRQPVRPRPPQSQMLYKARLPGKNILAMLTANMPVHAMPRAPPQLRNCSLGAMYAIPASDDMDKPVIRAASATMAAEDI